MQENIEPSLRIMELLASHPELREVLHRNGAFCDECVAANFDTVQQAAIMHGLDVQELIAQLRAAKSS
ncbi:DUF1858 domain-containing protein [Thermithiobacillus plumbiphilus]|uniref:DUF1858 domain-containing protein n=1 Tax=Thermithiobacillus plumbiphilus TaxID=1729899 RepID=A0ABU9DA72_9PROT